PGLSALVLVLLAGAALGAPRAAHATTAPAASARSADPDSSGAPAAIDVRPPAGGDEPPDAAFRRGVTALSAGAYHDAVDIFEELADRGFYHPDASFDRALAYIGRVRANAERPGDLGRAAAALEETLEARPGDREAEHTLELVRAEVAHRRARGGVAAEVEARPTLDRALIGLASEQTWSVLAALASALLTAGLLLRAASKGGAAHRAGTIATPLGTVALLVLLPLCAGARHLRLTTQPAVVVAQEARLGDERGVPGVAGAVPEAARVEIGDRE